jgi:hypothetical protein
MDMLQERSSECRGRGVGHFVQKAQTKTTRLLGDISTFLGTIDDILPSINATIDTLEGSKGDLQRWVAKHSLNQSSAEAQVKKTAGVVIQPRVPLFDSLCTLDAARPRLWPPGSSFTPQ